MLCKTKQLWEELSMETMTPKERIDAVIKHQAVDRTPFTVVDGGAWIAKTEGVTYRELYSRPDSGASSVVDYLNKIDSDMISAVSGVFTACLNACNSYTIPTLFYFREKTQPLILLAFSARFRIFS